MESDLICSICKKVMVISEIVTVFDGKRCHVECKEEWIKKWRKIKKLESW